MSNFICEHCGVEIREGANGNYVTECEHSPLEIPIRSMSQKRRIVIQKQINKDIMTKTES